jgi:hypothetical protein
VVWQSNNSKWWTIYWKANDSCTSLWCTLDVHQGDVQITHLIGKQTNMTLEIYVNTQQ